MKKETSCIYSFEKETWIYTLKKGITALFSKGFLYTFLAGFNRIYKRITQHFLFLRFKKCFIFDNKKLKYFFLEDGAFCERTIEVPLIKYFLRKYNYKNKRVLEIGNVLNLYKSHNMTVVDKYEKFPKVLNEDIITYKPKSKYDLVISISTLEHIGWDEIPKESRKFSKAIQHIKNKCLKKGGKLIFTVPIGYNTYMDRILKNHKIKLYKKYFFKRISQNNCWILTDEKEAFSKKYNFPYECANAIMLGLLKK